MRKVIESQHREIDLCFKVQRKSFSLIGIWKETNRHGFLGDDADLRSDRNHRVPLHQNLLQQRTFYQSISPNFGNYCNDLLLDDVGDCISGTDETTHCTYTERGRVSLRTDVAPCKLENMGHGLAAG